jgi:hypothetical protein
LEGQLNAALMDLDHANMALRVARSMAERAGVENFLMSESGKVADPLAKKEELLKSKTEGKTGAEGKAGSSDSWSKSSGIVGTMKSMFSSGTKTAAASSTEPLSEESVIRNAGADSAAATASTTTATAATSTSGTSDTTTASASTAKTSASTAAAQVDNMPRIVPTSAAQVDNEKLAAEAEAEQEAKDKAEMSEEDKRLATMDKDGKK